LNGIPRYTAGSHQQLQIGDKTHIIPPHTAVFVNNAALQFDEKYWGSDALLWRPDRWIQREAGSSDPESFVQPPENTYVPWGAGPRVCPGKKFSQVEFVAAIASLIRDHRVMPWVQAGETEQQARDRLMEVIGDSDMTLAMQVNHPERLKVRWEKRG
jgi:cytochrome P450